MVFGGAGIGKAVDGATEGVYATSTVAATPTGQGTEQVHEGQVLLCSVAPMRWPP